MLLQFRFQHTPLQFRLCSFQIEILSEIAIGEHVADREDADDNNQKQQREQQYGCQKGVLEWFNCVVSSGDQYSGHDDQAGSKQSPFLLRDQK